MDLSQLSDEELLALRERAAPAPAVDLSAMSDEDLLALREAAMPPPARSGGPVGRMAGVKRRPPTAQGFSGKQTPIDELSELEKVGHGIANTLEDIGLGATQLGNEGLRLIGVPGADERAARLRREAQAMATRQRPIDETTAGTIGGVLPSLVVPGSTLPRAIAGGAGYGALQPEEEEGTRLREATESGAAFGAGNVLARGVGAAVQRVRAPARGGKPATAQETQRAAEVKEAEELGLKVSVGGRTGGRFAKGLESVFEDIPIVSKRSRAFREANQSQANKRLAEQFGETAELLTPDVLSAAKSKVGAEFDKYVKAKTPISVDSRFMASMRDMKRQVELLPKEMRSPDLQRVVKVLYDDIEPAWRRGDVKIDGARYKAIREELTDSARTLYKEGGQKTAGRIGEVVDALDAMAGRSVPAEQQAAYKAARKQWMALRVAEDAVDESGNVVRGKLNQSIKRHMPKPGTGKDIYRKLSRSMKITQEGVPNSGTPSRGLAMATLASPALALTGIPGMGGEASPLDYAQAAAVPLAVQAMMLNPRTARYITRQLGAKGPAAEKISDLMRRGAGAGAYGTLESLYRQ